MSALLSTIDARIADLRALGAQLVAAKARTDAAIEAETARIYGDDDANALTQDERDRLNNLDEILVPGDDEVVQALAALMDLREAIVKARQRCEAAGIATEGK